MAEEKKKRAPKVRRREKKNVPVGHVHIAASFNNTLVSITALTGAVLSWGSGGVAGFKGSRKSTPYAASLGAEAAARTSLRCRLRKGTRRRTRAGNPRPSDRGPRHHCNYRCDAAATQWLPSSKEAPSLGE